MVEHAVAGKAMRSTSVRLLLSGGGERRFSAPSKKERGGVLLRLVMNIFEVELDMTGKQKVTIMLLILCADSLQTKRWQYKFYGRSLRFLVHVAKRE
jgi:hypothetical protein